MFKYFPTNYVWNLSVDLSIEMGARIGEIEEMCAPLQDAAKAPDAAGTRAFREAWVKMADKLVSLAEEDDAKGRIISAGDKRIRASNYMQIAERLQAMTPRAGSISTSVSWQPFSRGRNSPARRSNVSRSPMKASICPRFMFLQRTSPDRSPCWFRSTGSIPPRR